VCVRESDCVCVCVNYIATAPDWMDFWPDGVNVCVCVCVCVFVCVSECE